MTLEVQREFELVAHASRGGELVVSPASEDGFHPSGTQVQLTAVPAAGQYFVGWEHDLAGTETTRSVIMDRDRRATAQFSAAEPVLAPFGEALPTESLTGRHFVRVPDGTSAVAVRFESSSTARDAAFYVTDGAGRRELGATRLRQSDTIRLTRETLSRMRDKARLNPAYDSHHLLIRQRGSSAWSGQLHVSIQRDWIGGVWPPAFTFVSSAGWSRPLRQTLRVASVEGEIPPVRYRIVSDSHWLEAFPPEWTGGQGEAEIAVTANGAALGAEAYGGKLRILIDRGGDPAEGWTPTGIEIPVHFVVKPADGAGEPTGDGSTGLVGGDDHGDARSAATELAAGAATRGRLERVGDADWFRFRTTAATTWVTAYTVSDGDTVGELHVAGRASPLADDDSGSGANFRIVTSVPAGTHYLRVGGFGTPDYALTLEAVADDHGDTRDAATEVAVGASARGRLERVGDADWFRFRTTAATTWVTAYTVSDGDTVGELHVAGRASPLADDDSGSGANFRIVTSVPAGTHYLRVGGSGTPDYALTLQEMPDAMEFVRIPAGSFVMGSPEDEQGRSSVERQHEVRISRDFWMGKYEVTQGEWEAVMGSNPSYFDRCGVGCPVESVSWEDVQEFVRKLNERESGSGHAYRLPTEAEWEYAARAGTTGARHGELDEIAWHGLNADWRTHRVGQKRANAWGLHDMLGNVWEWTADWYGTYPSGAVTDPAGPSTGSSRVYRGGGSSEAKDVRSAVRSYGSPGYRGGIGFRLVRTNGEPTGGGSTGLVGGDDHGDARSAATELAAGASVSGRLERVGDADWFRFRTTAAHTLITAYTESDGDTAGELHVAGGRTVADDDSGSGANFRIGAGVPAGTHYLRVGGFGTPDYALTLEAVADDHGDTRDAATEVAVGASARGRLERVGDADWFRFRTTAAHTLITAYTESDGDTAGELHVAGGRTVADDDSGSGANFRITAGVPAGTHYLRVSGSGTPDYALTLEAVADDHGDTRDAATEVAVGASARGRLERVGDADWFRFRTTAAHTLITAYTESDGDTAGELHVAGGRTVADDDSGSGANFRITAGVPAGTHYLRVSGHGTEDYTLTLQEVLDAMEFARIPAGSFVMGSPEDEQGRSSVERQHEVRISRDFWMGKYEVTQGEWEAVMGSNPSLHKVCGAQCPVENVSWDDAQEFIRKLNERESGSGYAYRLPTEAEWEYAARAGTTGARHGELDEIAWYGDNIGWTTHPVGQKRPNAWGLHDMLGNVNEWTADWFGRYPSGAVTDPTGPSTGSYRVFRGGGWGDYARYVRSAARLVNSPGHRGYDLGFRLVRTD